MSNQAVNNDKITDECDTDPEKSQDNTQEDDPCDRFEQMNLKETLLRGVFAYGFEKPSVIQSRAIVPVTKGGDIIAQSQSGTGKTGAFVISSLQRIDEKVRGCQVLIVAHTRELANQITKVCKNISQYMKNIGVVCCTGGINVRDNLKAIRDATSDGPCIAVGTPGRLIDMIRRRTLPINHLKMMIVDEADEMLSPGFDEQIRDIIELIPQSTQICLFSATMPGAVIELSHKFMNNAQLILVKTEELTLEGIAQFYIDVHEDNYKVDTLCDLFDQISVSQSIIFVNTKDRADRLADAMTDNKFAVSVIHSNMSPEERRLVMTEFEIGKTRTLIATDVMARGIDVQQVSVVINFDIPDNKECYIHRIGRSGRFGRKGVAINFATKKDSWKIEELERFYSTQIDALPTDIAKYIN